MRLRTILSILLLYTDVIIILEHINLNNFLSEIDFFEDPAII